MQSSEESDKPTENQHCCIQLYMIYGPILHEAKAVRKQRTRSDVAPIVIAIEIVWPYEYTYIYITIYMPPACPLALPPPCQLAGLLPCRPLPWAVVTGEFLLYPSGMIGLCVK